MRGVILIMLITTCGCMSSAFAQPYTTIKFSYYSTGNGLDATNIRKTIQDSIGFIWAATQDGLYRFDGNAFIGYNKSKDKNHAITGGDIRDICIKDSVLWAVNSYGGFDAININDGKVIFSFNQQSDALLKDVLFVTLAIKDNILFLGSNKGLYKFNIEKKILSYQNVISGNAKDTLDVQKLIIDSIGNLWIFSGLRGIGVIPHFRSQPKIFCSTNSLSFNDCSLTNNGVLAATNLGPRHFTLKGDSIVELPTFAYLCKQILTNPVYSINRDRYEKVWLSNKNSLFVTFPLSKKTETVSPSRLNNGKNWTSSVFGIFFDFGNNVWLSCQQGIASAVNKPSEFLCITKSHSSPTQINHAYYLFPYSDSTLLVCAEDGLFRVNHHSKSISIIDSRRSYFFAFKNIDNSILVSNDEGTFSLSNNKLIPIEKRYKEFRSTGPLVINSRAQLTDSTFLFGSQNYRGVYVWNIKAKTVLNISPQNGRKELTDVDINSVFKQPADSDALILTASSLFKFDINTNKISQVPLFDAITNEKITILYDVVKLRNKFYLATYGNGIVVLDENFKFLKKITTNAGLTNDCVYKLLPYNDSILFATTNNGLSVINLLNGTIDKYFIQDGIHSNNFEELSGAIRKDLLFAGGVDGLTVVAPALFNRNLSRPILSINKVQIDSKASTVDTIHYDLKKIVIPNNFTQVKIFFTAINYTSPSDIIYKYKINEINQDWLSNGNQTYLNLVGINPGVYHLNVKAINKEGIESEIKELILVFQPKWHQSWWFKICLTIIATLILLGLYKLRINQLKHEHEIKERLAKDLHDDLGSTMNSVKIYAHLAMLHEDKIKHLQKIEESSKEAIAAIKDMIWILDDDKGGLVDLKTRIDHFAAPLCQASTINYASEISPDAKICKLSQQEKRNLYMMIKELVNNSIKYSLAREIALAIYSRKSKTLIIFRDDGIGFDFEKIIKGNGLKNIFRRAKEIGYQVTFETQVGNGVSVSISKI